MNTSKTFIQAMDYQKTLFDNSLSLLASLQEQGQQVVETAMAGNSLVPDGSREIYSQWVDYLKQNNQICREYMENSFDQIKDVFGEEKPKPAASKPKTGTKKE